MDIYIIALYRNEWKKETSYFVADIVRREALFVSEEKLIRKYNDKAIDLMNAVCENNSVEGKYYDLYTLPYIAIDESNKASLKFYDGTKVSDKYLVLKESEHKWYVCNGIVSKTGGKPSLQGVNKLKMEIISDKDIQNLLHSKKILNAEYFRYRESISDDIKCYRDPVQNNTVTNNSDSYNKRNNNRLEQLEQEAYNKNVVWQVSDFEEFMNNHGWEFKIREFVNGLTNEKQYTLFGVSPECNILHIPYGVTLISDDLFKNNPTNNPIIIFPSSLKKLDLTYYTKYHFWDEMQINDLISVDSIYFQWDNSKDMYNDGNSDHIYSLGGLNISNGINLPQSESIKSFCYDCIINNIDFTDIVRYNNINKKDYKINIIKCFHDIRLTGQSKITLDYMTFNNSFDMIGGIDEIVLGKNIGIIDGSFKESHDLANIRFCDGSTDYIYDSFKGLHNIQSVDLHDRKIEEISRSFSTCINLTNVILPSNLKTLNTSFVKNIDDGEKSIDVLRIPASVENITYPICNMGTKLIFEKGRDCISASLYTNMGFKYNIEFEDDNIKTLCGKFNITYLDMDFADLHLPKTIEDLVDTERMFQRINLGIVDLRLLPNIHTIKNLMFSYSVINTLIIGNNINKVEKYAFKDATIHKIIIGECVGVEKGAFTGLNTGKVKLDTEGKKPAQAYVVENSSAYKELKTRNAQIINIESLDEILETLNNGNTDPNRIPIFNMILNNSEYSDLLEEPYVKNVDIAYKIIQDLKANRRHEDRAPKLINQDKFRKMSLDNMKSVPRFIEVTSSYMNGIQETIDKKPSWASDADFEKIENDKYISLCNVITTFFEREDKMYSDQFIKTLDTAVINLADVIFCAFNKLIALINIKSLGDKQLNALYIIDGDSIIYATTCDMTSYRLWVRYSGSISLVSSCMSAFSDQSRYNVALSHYLKSGDVIVLNELKVNGIKLPDSYYSLFSDIINNTWVFLGSKSQNTSLNSGSRYGTRSYIELMLYDMLASKIILAKSNKLEVANTRITSFNDLYIIGVYDINEVEKIQKEDKKYLEVLSDMSDKSKYRQLIDLMDMTKEYVDSVYMDDNNFDLNGNIELCKLADYAFKNDITTLKSQSCDSKFINAVLESCLYRPFKVSISKLQSDIEYLKGLRDGTIKGNEKRSKKFLDYESLSAIRINRSDDIVIRFKENFYTDQYWGNPHQEYMGLKYLAAVINTNTSIKSKDILKYSFIDINDAIALLYNIGKHRNAFRNKYGAYVDYNRAVDVLKHGDSIVNIEDYAFPLAMNSNYKLPTSVEESRYSKRLETVDIAMGINMLTGDFYLLGNLKGNDTADTGNNSNREKYMFSLLRFKEPFMLWNIIIGFVYGHYDLVYEKINGMKILSIREAYNMVNNAYYSGTNLNGYWTGLRDQIINGVPNNFPCLTLSNEADVLIFNSLCKQKESSKYEDIGTRGIYV